MVSLGRVEHLSAREPLEGWAYGPLGLRVWSAQGRLRMSGDAHERWHNFNRTESPLAAYQCRLEEVWYSPIVSWNKQCDPATVLGIYPNPLRKMNWAAPRLFFCAYNEEYAIVCNYLVLIN